MVGASGKERREMTSWTFIMAHSPCYMDCKSTLIYSILPTILDDYVAIWRLLKIFDSATSF